MKPVIVITFPHPLSAPGGGTVGLLEIARHLAGLGVRVILVPVGNGAPSEAVPAEVSPVGPSRWHYLLNGIAVALRVRQLLYRQPVAAVLGWDHEAAFLPGLLRRSGVFFGMIAAFPSYRLWLERRTSWRPLKRVSDWWFQWRPLRLADAVFALSRFTREELVSLLGVGPERVVVAYWGVDDSFLQVERMPGSSGPGRLLFFGALTRHKGIFDALEALARLPPELGWELRVAGWGDVDAVNERARALGLDRRTVVVGRLDHRALLGHLAWAQLAVLPSYSESFGLAIAEAQAAGLPVVTYRAGAIPEVVEDRVTGLLVKPGDIGGLAEAVRVLLTDPQLRYRMGLAGRERVRRLFSWENTARTILDSLRGAHKCG